MRVTAMFDFDTILDRRATGSLKWDVAENELPMWVADMDFDTAPAIKQALIRRIEQGALGYNIVPDAWAKAYASWWQTRHGFVMKEENLIFTTGVVPALSSAVRKLTTPAENVLILTPVYNIFYNSILNNGRRVLECPLVYKDGAYAIDYADLERKLAEPQTSLMIFCNPHNPVGKIWDRETLTRVGALAARYGVTVISDEIHCDLCDPGREYVPFASASDVNASITVTCVAPTKAFNLAGLQTAAVYADDPVLRHKMWRALNTDEVAEPNALAVIAAVTAFTECGGWLDELRAYLYDNKRFVTDYIRDNIPQLAVVEGQATYLMWIDARAIQRSDLASYIRETSGLYLSAGEHYGKGGEGFLRLNVACPRTLLRDGLDRLRRSITLLDETKKDG